METHDIAATSGRSLPNGRHGVTQGAPSDATAYSAVDTAIGVLVADGASPAPAHVTTLNEGEDVYIGHIQKNRRERPVCRWRSFKGGIYCDVRLHALNETAGWWPSKTGLAFRADLLEEVIGLLTAARAVAKERGLIPGPLPPSIGQGHNT